MFELYILTNNISLIYYIFFYKRFIKSCKVILKYYHKFNIKLAKIINIILKKIWDI